MYAIKSCEWDKFVEQPGFELNAFFESVRNGAIEWKRHVLERMVERGLRRTDIVDVLLNGERIEGYPSDLPFPSALFLGWVKARPLHVVAAYDPVACKVYVITAYEPDAQHFERDFRTRKPMS